MILRSRTVWLTMLACQCVLFAALWLRQVVLTEVEDVFRARSVPLLTGEWVRDLERGTTTQPSTRPSTPIPEGDE